VTTDGKDLEARTFRLVSQSAAPLSAGQLRQSLRALDLQLSDEQRHRIDAAGERGVRAG
jgi:flagellar basal body rod protein FlgF